MYMHICLATGCGLWRQGKGDWHRRIPACFLPHIRPPGLASSNLESPSRSCEGMGQETSIDSLDDSFDSTHLESAAGIVDSVAAVMEGTLMVIPLCIPMKSNVWCDSCRCDSSWPLPSVFFCP